MLSNGLLRGSGIPRALGMWDARGPPLTLSSVPALFGQFAFRDDVPLVRLEVADEWARPEQAVVRYRVETVFARSSWDWIGLYRVRLRRIWWGRKSLWRKEGACRPPVSLVYPVFDALWEAASFRGSQPRFLIP